MNRGLSVRSLDDLAEALHDAVRALEAACNSADRAIAMADRALTVVAQANEGRCQRPFECACRDCCTGSQIRCTAGDDADDVLAPGAAR